MMNSYGNQKIIPKISDKVEEEALKKRLTNVDFIKNLDRIGLEFQKNERQLLINKFNNESIFIQYPGKESKISNYRPWDFRPKIVGNKIIEKDLAFTEIWKSLYEISKKDSRVMKLVAVEFYRIAYMIEYNLCEEYITNVIDINKGSKIDKYETKKNIYIYKPDTYIIGELEKIEKTILGMSWEAFFAYNDLIGFNEDCKYYYKELKTQEKKQSERSKRTPEKRTETKIKNGLGRKNTFFNHMEIIINLDQGELCVESMIDLIGKLIQGRGIAKASIKDVALYLSDYTY